MTVSIGVVAPTYVASSPIGLHVSVPAALRCHWRVGDGVPVTATVKVVLLPAINVTETGWVVKIGGTGTGLTVRVATLLVAAGGTPLFATARNSSPDMSVVVPE